MEETEKAPAIEEERVEVAPTAVADIIVSQGEKWVQSSLISGRELSYRVEQQLWRA